MTRHLLTGAELSADETHALLARAAQLKAQPRQPQVLDGRSVALIFEKPSTRTRLSFDVGVQELGGHPVVLRGDEMQLSRGESPRDTALVLSPARRSDRHPHRRRRDHRRARRPTRRCP
ncbi:MAG: hypothetical protein PGN13_13295 [Patulibacter minatonensis]